MEGGGTEDNLTSWLLVNRRTISIPASKLVSIAAANALVVALLQSSNHANVSLLNRPAGCRLP